MVFFCVDIGGTNTLIGMGNGEFEVKKKLSSGRFLETPLETLDSMLDQEGYSRSDVDSTAVAVAGPMDKDKRVFYPPNIDTESVDLSILGKIGELRLVNDCTSAALGEYHYGEHDSQHMVYVTVSSGVGAGMISDGEVVSGSNGNFAEVGHMTVGDRLACGCGGQGHWEAYCSGNNLPSMASELFGVEAEDAREIFDRAESGDPEAKKVIEKFRSVNSRAVSEITTLYNPDLIVFGGAVSINHEQYLPDPENVDSVNRAPRIEKCSLGEESVIHGLRAVCNDKMYPD